MPFRAARLFPTLGAILRPASVILVAGLLNENDELKEELLHSTHKVELLTSMEASAERHRIRLRRAVITAVAFALVLVLFPKVSLILHNFVMHLFRR